MKSRLSKNMISSGTDARNRSGATSLFTALSTLSSESCSVYLISHENDHEAQIEMLQMVPWTLQVLHELRHTSIVLRPHRIVYSQTIERHTKFFPLLLVLYDTIVFIQILKTGISVMSPTDTPRERSKKDPGTKSKSA